MATRTGTPTPRPGQAEYRDFAVAVRRIERLAPHFTRVTLAGDDLGDFHAAGLDQRVKVVFPVPGSGLVGFPRGGSDWYGDWCALPEDQRCPMRTYTIRASRPELRELDIDFVVHGDSGPATRWVNRATVGDEVLLIGPAESTLIVGEGPISGVEFRSGDARRVLLAGDETAVPAICSILEGLPAEAAGRAFIEVPAIEDILPVTAPDGVSVTWLAREARPGMGHGVALDRAVRAWTSEMVVGPADEALAPAASEFEQGQDGETLWEVPASDDGRELYAWIAGEAGCIRGLRRFLVRETGLDRRDVAFMGYWRIGSSEG